MKSATEPGWWKNDPQNQALVLAPATQAGNDTGDTGEQVRSATKNKIGQDKAYLKWIRSLPCSVPGCRAIFIEPHHAGPRGMSTRVHDREAIPLCIAHHQNGAGPHAIHGPLGKNWWAFHNLDRKELIAGLNAKYEAEHLGVLNPLDVIGATAI